MTSVQWHSDYQASLKGKDLNSLHYIIEDCRSAIEAMPENPKAGQYADEIHYCNAEIQRRKNTQGSKSKAKLLEEFCKKHEIKTVVVDNYIQAIAKFEEV